MVFMFTYSTIVCDPQLRKILRIHQETNYVNPAGNYFENGKSDTDDDMVSDVEFNDDSDIE